MTDPVRGALFNRPAFTRQLQSSQSACEDTGWTALSSSATASPVWEKQHSWGEFVFDQNFAQAYAEAGLDYYPKLVCAVPFTPVPGPRLGADPVRSAADLAERSEAAGYSSAHVLFLPADETRPLDPERWLLREDLRYVWHNRDYPDFEGFLSGLRSKRRKTVRSERRQVASFGFDIGWQTADTLSDADWQRIYALYASTYHMRGQQAYLRPECLRGWGQELPEQMLFCLARQDGEIQAMAFFFQDGRHLYGRHWGAARDWPGLHFELCYYQAMDYCIGAGITFFDAGVQGRHRLLRGFEPELSRSVHRFNDPRFHAAISAFLQRERALVREQFAALQEQTAYRQTKC